MVYAASMTHCSEGLTFENHIRSWLWERGLGYIGRHRDRGLEDLMVHDRACHYLLPRAEDATHASAQCGQRHREDMATTQNWDLVERVPSRVEFG